MPRDRGADARQLVAQRLLIERLGNAARIFRSRQASRSYWHAAGEHGQALQGSSSSDSPVSTSNDASGPSASSSCLRASASLA
jgi:hypothetical protein